MKLRNKKTGEIREFGYLQSDYVKNLVLTVDNGKESVEMFGYNSLAELNAEWEDYVPKEPLIKDEKIRKAVRAWSEALDTECCSFRADHDIFDFIAIGANCLRFDMSDGWGTYKLEDIPNGWHTITELCGEEEDA